MLNERLAAVHCVWLSPEDCYLLAERKANAVGCTVSNLKLTSGVAPLNTMMKANVNVCLGTDGASSNNNLNLFEEMKVTAIVQKNASYPAAFTAEQVWRLATKTPAGPSGQFGAASGRSGRPGPHRPATLVLPPGNIISHLVYSMTGEDTTIVNGKVLMQGVIPGEAEIWRRLRSASCA
jgi:5-methylthioadenosine/S-adenosylhomocysteine deaminase